MRHIIALAVLLGFSLTASAADIRLQPLKDLNGYFPFRPPGSLPEWEQRNEYVRRQILVAAGLWPTPTKTPLNAVIHGKIDCEGYTVEKVYFESAPGFFVLRQTAAGDEHDEQLGPVQPAGRGALPEHHGLADAQCRARPRLSAQPARGGPGEENQEDCRLP